MNLHLLTRLPTALLALGASSTSVTALVPQVPNAVARPADRQMMFRVRGPKGATVFLLGSVHLLSPEAGKLPATVDSAFDRAKTVAFETSLDTLQARAME